MPTDRTGSSRALALTALLPVLVFAVGPVLLLVLRAFLAPGALVGAWDAGGRDALWNTLRISAGAALFALLVGGALTLLLFRTDLPARTLFAALFTLPSAIPPFIWGMGWISLANPKAGYLNRAVGEGVFNIYGATGIAFVLGAAGLPLVLLAGAAALARVDPALEEAARLCGASPLRALANVSLPLALPALLSGTTLVFLYAASAFGVPYMLGVSANPPTQVLTTIIYAQYLLGPNGTSRALVLAAALLALATIVLAANQLLARAGRVRLAAGKGIAPRPLPLGRWRAPLTVVVAALAASLVALPLLAIVLTSFQTSYGAPLSQLTLSHWAETLRSSEVHWAAARSLTLAAGAGLLVCLFGLLVALARRRLGRVGRVAEAIASWPYAVPGTVLAMALLVAFFRDLRFVAFDRVAFVLALGNTLWMLLVAYAGKHLVLGVRNTSDALDQLDPSLVESARIFGAKPARAFVDVTLPLLRPALASAFVLTFLICCTELTMSVLLVPPGASTLGTLLFQAQTYTDPLGASVLACAFVLLVVVAMAALAVIRSRERRS